MRWQVLITSDYICKVADFGLSRNVQNHEVP